MSNQITPNPSVPSQVVAEVKFPQVINNLGIIPTSYKDSMSYYECLAWLCKYLEETVIPSVNQNGNAVQELQSLYIELNDYVTNYFENLDVQEEINNKLDEMASTGVLQQLLTEQYDSLREDVTDIITHNSEFIESQINSLQNQIDGITDINPIPVLDTSEMVNTSRIYVNTTNGYWYYYNEDNSTWTQGGLYQSTGINDNSITGVKLKNNILKNQNMKYLISKYNMNSCVNYVSTFYGMNSSGVIFESGKNRLVSFDYFNFTKNPVFKSLFDNVYYFVNIYQEIDKAENSFDFTSLDLELGTLNGTDGATQPANYIIRTSDFITVESDTLFEPDVYNYIPFVFKYNTNGTFIERINLDTTTKNYTLTSSYKYKFAFKLSTSSNGNITNNLNYYINSIKNSILTEFVGQATTGWQNATLTYTNNVNYLYKICAKLGIAGSDNFSEEDILKEYIIVSDDLSTPLQNKKISVLGDSFSAYAGFIPSGNEAYYTGSNAGVSNVNQMWWQRIINNNGATRDTINAYSGANVSSIRNQSYCLSNTSMCENIGTPDIVIIMAGINDFSHSPALLGDYSGNTSFPSTNENFADAYALMLSRITDTYKTATVFCCGLPVFVRTNTTKNQPEQNTETDDSHKTTVDYNNKIKEISEMFNCQYIDLNKCGFNRENYYSTYCQDNASTPTHPNAKGHEVISRVVEAKLIEVMNNRS